jgi:hypothetical protein
MTNSQAKLDYPASLSDSEVHDIYSSSYQGLHTKAYRISVEHNMPLFLFLRQFSGPLNRITHEKSEYETLKSQVFWYVTPCRVNSSRRFQAIGLLHPQDDEATSFRTR